MGALENYKSIIQRVLTEYASIPYSHGDMRSMPIFDTEHDRYLVVTIGWDGPRRVHDIVIHLDIIGSKIWIQCDNTDAVVAHDLERAGVPKKDIVLGFQPPEVRPLTEYAVA
jgi:hypothetical protein